MEEQNIPIGKVAPNIIQSLKDRFSILSEYYLKKLSIPPFVFLTSSVDEPLIEIKIATNTDDISGATGSTTFFTVPTGKRWKLIGAGQSDTTGSSALGISDGSTIFWLSSSGTTGIKEPKLSIPMDTGWTVEALNTNNVADNARNAEIIYEESDVS
jgi:hypothetical protein